MVTVIAVSGVTSLSFVVLKQMKATATTTQQLPPAISSHTNWMKTAVLYLSTSVSYYLSLLTVTVGGNSILCIFFSLLGYSMLVSVPVLLPGSCMCVVYLVHFHFLSPPRLDLTQTAVTTCVLATTRRTAVDSNKFIFTV